MISVSFELVPAVHLLLLKLFKRQAFGLNDEYDDVEANAVGLEEFDQ
jgi:hypothetical protein